jgi:hypothetical protein
MTITTRSKRVSPFAAAGSRHHATSAAVGPGAYSPEKTRTSFPNAATAGDDPGGCLAGSCAATRPLFSGFATSERRYLNENRTTSAYTPGERSCSSHLTVSAMLTDLYEWVRSRRLLVITFQCLDCRRAVQRVRHQGESSIMTRALQASSTSMTRVLGRSRGSRRAHRARPSSARRPSRTTRGPAATTSPRAAATSTRTSRRPPRRRHPSRSPPCWQTTRQAKL